MPMEARFCTAPFKPSPNQRGYGISQRIGPSMHNRDDYQNSNYGQFFAAGIYQNTKPSTNGYHNQCRLFSTDWPTSEGKKPVNSGSSANFNSKPLTANDEDIGTIAVQNKFDSANDLLNTIIFKLLNKTVEPGNVMHACVYFDVKKALIIHSMTVNCKGYLIEQKCEEKAEKTVKTETPTTSFSVICIGSETGNSFREPGQYKQQTDDFSSTQIDKRINLIQELPENDILLKPFKSPIKLVAGTHTVPFAFRVPANTHPTNSRILEGKRDKFTLLQHFNLVDVDVVVKPDGSDSSSKVTTGQLSLNVLSSGRLPPVRNGAYTPGFAKLFTLSASKILLTMDKLNYELSDTIRIQVFTNNIKSIKSVEADFVILNDPIEVNDVSDPKLHKDFILEKSSSEKVNKKYTKFISDVSTTHPINGDTDLSIEAFDDQALLPESERAGGCLIEMEIKPVQESSCEIAGNRIKYFVRTHISTKEEKKDTIHAQFVTLNGILTATGKSWYDGGLTK